jgi:hypothetical protein
MLLLLRQFYRLFLFWVFPRPSGSGDARREPSYKEDGWIPDSSQLSARYNTTPRAAASDVQVATTRNKEVTHHRNDPKTTFGDFLPFSSVFGSEFDD